MKLRPPLPSGELYPWNAAGDAELREALPPGAWDGTTRAVRAAVRTTWLATRRRLPRGALVWCGFDFLVARGGASVFLIEVNVKPWTRYVDPELFPMPYARELAHAACDDLAAELTRAAAATAPLAARARLPAATADDGGVWVDVSRPGDES